VDRLAELRLLKAFHVMRLILAFIFLLSTAFGASAQAPKAEITLTARPSNFEDIREVASSTLRGFEFQAEIRDPDVDFSRLDLFTNAENSHKEKPRKQNVFVRVTRKDTGAAVPLIFTESGDAGGNNSKILFLEVVVPFSDKERVARIEAAIKAIQGTPNAKLFNQPNEPTPVQFFDALGLRESQPGEYIVQVDYIAPSGKVSSNSLPFTIRDKGNLYERVIRSIKPGP
jgi:hypothetical protein